VYNWNWSISTLYVIINKIMIDSIINCKNIKEADVLLMTVGYDRTASSRKGAVNGGMAVIKCLQEEVEFFDRYTKMETGYKYKISHMDMGNLNDFYPEDMVSRVKEKYKNIYLKKERFPVLLGGEHSVSIGAFQAISEIENSKNITVVQIDAHPDLRNNDSNANPDQSRPSSFAHSCVMRRVYELGFKIVQVGIRSYSKEEYDFLKNNPITVFEWGLEKTPTIQKIINSIKTEKVYIEIDVDGIDPAYLPATGTPVQGGLEWWYTINLLNKIIKTKDVIGLGILEVAPVKYDVRTEYGAAQLCYNVISGQLFKKNKI
jgi:agmatinase